MYYYNCIKANLEPRCDLAVVKKLDKRETVKYTQIFIYYKLANCRRGKEKG